jgi:hypothetical protein
MEQLTVNLGYFLQFCKLGFRGLGLCLEFYQPPIDRLHERVAMPRRMG